MKKNGPLFVIALSCCLCAAPLAADPISRDSPEITAGSVYQALDGDTFIVNLTDPESYARLKRGAEGDVDRLKYFNDHYLSVRIRLANTDTAESNHKDSSLNTPAGERVSALVGELVNGKPTLVSCYDWGRHGRLICNLALPSGGKWSDLGAWLIQQGYSNYDTSFGPNPFLNDEYLTLELRAH